MVQWNRIQNPEINAYIYGQLILKKKKGRQDIFWLHQMAYGILVPSLGLKAPSPNHWTAREFPASIF